MVLHGYLRHTYALPIKLHICYRLKK